eukprot:GHRQ01010013.1.p1 GENE.GHRQ01010013.1~~GHRQ01010013.1.p1  ORF type:complete len:311 (-),score=67.21 GHRQ01010013.1:266-1198(-)
MLTALVCTQTGMQYAAATSAFNAQVGSPKRAAPIACMPERGKESRGPFSTADSTPPAVIDLHRPRNSCSATIQATEATLRQGLANLRPPLTHPCTALLLRNATLHTNPCRTHPAAACPHSWPNHARAAGQTALMPAKRAAGSPPAPAAAADALHLLHLGSIPPHHRRHRCAQFGSTTATANTIQPSASPTPPPTLVITPTPTAAHPELLLLEPTQPHRPHNNGTVHIVLTATQDAACCAHPGCIARHQRLAPRSAAGFSTAQAVTCRHFGETAAALDRNRAAGLPSPNWLLSAAAAAAWLSSAADSACLG